MGKQLLLCLVISLFTVQTAEAKKLYYSIQDLTAVADLIVTGKIIGVSENSYSFAIDQTIKGSPTKPIIVKMFREWTCDVRLKRAETGQSLLLFLTKASKDSFDIINGSSGELFIEDGQLHSFWGLKEAPELDEVLVGLKSFLSCYAITNKEFFPGKRPVFMQLKADTEILRSRNLNKFSSWLFDGIKNYKIEVS